MVVPFDTSAIARMEALGQSSVTVSVCCGPSGISPFAWSVQAMCRGEEFDRPFAANSFEHAVEIAEIESKRRGWIKS